MAAIVEKASEKDRAQRKDEALASAAPTHEPGLGCRLRRRYIAAGALFENGKLVVCHFQSEQRMVGDIYPRFRAAAVQAAPWFRELATWASVHLGNILGAPNVQPAARGRNMYVKDGPRFAVMPVLWRVAKAKGYVTAADFVHGRYRSRALP